ncbi:hypothetical protein [Cupriavidus sp. TMH.W2]|uniref:hypothetical protein n=1 Tax=Cupriavidus sp. TMH.W2 TaxID=3434465 RepID=UPI003D78432A
MRSWSRGKPKLTLEEMRAIAQRRGGECLATEYVRGRSHLPWRCHRGHEWSANGESVKAGSWCPACAIERNQRRLRIRGYLKCQQIAREHGGRFLSPTYEDNKTPALWECKKKHRWPTKPVNVFAGHWCLICANEKKSKDNTNLTIEDMQKLAAKKHGRCRSTVYRNVYHPLDWECALGHQWPTAPANIIAGHWCSECGRGLSERICRAVFVSLFGMEFPRVRPKWLIGARDARLELDGYCEGLKLAFEYHGAQHFVKVRSFKMDGRRLSALQARDELKRARCRERGITLIEIPYTVPNQAIESHIRTELERTGFARKEWRRRPPVDLDQLEIIVDERLTRCQTMASEHSGAFLNSQYLGQSVNHRWRCREGHIFPLTPRAVRRGGWCPICRKTEQATRHRVETFEKIQRRLAQSGGRLESTEFVSQNAPLQLLCKYGHRWATSWASLRHGTACPVCRRRPERLPTAP